MNVQFDKLYVQNFPTYIYIITLEIPDNICMLDIHRDLNSQFAKEKKKKKKNAYSKDKGTP